MPTTIRMAPELEMRYTELAQRTGRSRAYYINEALEESIDRLEYEHALLMDAADYRAGRVQAYSLDEIEKRHGLAD